MVTQDDIERFTINNYLWNLTGDIWANGNPMSRQQIHYWYECLDWWEKEFVKKEILKRYNQNE